ncbi:MAG: molybdopterin-guanine dinucleotide biosynthesis protein B, partial [Pseudomonadota bacterium]
RISVVKHAHHRFDIDHPGKDSYRLREVGAAQMMIGSSRRWALMTELSNEMEEPELADLLAEMDTKLADLILVEGFRHAPIAKIEVYRAALGTPLLALEDPSIIAVATDSAVAATQPQLDINDVAAIASYVMQWRAGSRL